MAQLRQETEKSDADIKKKEHDIKNPGMGYGGKFGIEKDRMDKSAVGHDYISKGRMIQYLPRNLIVSTTIDLLFQQKTSKILCLCTPFISLESEVIVLLIYYFWNFYVKLVF